MRYTDHMGNISWHILTTWAIYAVIRWPCEHYMVGHTGYMDTTNRCTISWDTLTTWAIYEIHYDHVNNMNQRWPHEKYMRFTLTTWQYIKIHADHVANMCDLFWPCRQHGSMHYIMMRSDHIMIHSDHVANMCWFILTMWTACRPHGLIQHIMRHSDHVGNICWDIPATWTT
jgi:hypothetical protein